MKQYFILLLTLLGVSGSGVAAEGLITIPSHHTVSETADRLEAILGNKGMTILTQSYLFSAIPRSAAP
jgi:hypothetical protein